MIIKRNQEFLRYLNQNLKPQYKTHDGAHNEQHLEEVLRRALELGRFVGYPREDMIICCAYFHDIGLDQGREGHEKRSGDRLRRDKTLERWFTKEEIEEMAQAVEDHRASLEGEPRSVLGKIISDSDRVMIPERVIERSLKFNSEKFPGKTKEEVIEIVYNYLKGKYGSGEYAKLWIPYQPSEKEKKEFENLLRQKEKFIILASQIYDNIKK